MNRVHSICVVNWNSAPTVERWARSLLANLAPADEVVIVDNESTDGSGRYLRELSRRHGFRFLSQRTNRGEAREIASRMATGDYIIGLIDTDDIVLGLQEAKLLYHEVLETDPIRGNPRAFVCPNFFILPRWMLEAVEGWPDLQHYEDQLLAYRLATRDWLSASWRVSPVRRGRDPKKRRLTMRFRYAYHQVRDGLRLGFFEARNLQAKLLFPLAWPAARFAGGYEFRRDWWSFDVWRDDFILPWIAEREWEDRLLIRGGPRGPVWEATGRASPARARAGPSSEEGTTP